MGTWRTERVFFSSKLYFDDLLAGLTSARHSIEFETYIFDDDELGTAICKQLMSAAGRGVRVKVMVDGFGSPRWMDLFFDALRKAGVEARVYHPLPLSALFTRAERYPSIGNFFRRLSTMNERNHRKVCIVDGVKAWTGGMNVSLRHFNWRDTGVFVEGDGVQNLSYAFFHAWERAWTPEREKLKKKRWLDLGSLVSQRLSRLNATRLARKIGYRKLLEQIANAKTRVWITNAYFVPPRRLLQTLRIAATCGTDVRVLVPKDPPDLFFIQWVSSALYFGLLNAGVRIFEYLPAPLHAKTSVIDNVVTIGTSNLNHRSLIHDLEVDVILESPKSIKEMIGQFDGDLKQSQEVTLQAWKVRPWRHRIVGRILLWFRYWI